MKMLSTAIKLASIYHDGQFDKAGKPYILHPLRVMHYLKSEDEELNCIAALHDIVEDTEITLEDLSIQGMSLRVIEAVDLLTKKEGQTNEDYLSGILTNRDAMQVKLCDLRHNMDARRMKGLREKDFIRMQKYCRMYSIIEEHLK